MGARQVGKTTLVRDLYGRGAFFSLDHESTLRAVNSDAYNLFAETKRETMDGPIIVDEAQRSHRMILAIKSLVDSDRSRGQFLLTGSSNIFTSVAALDSLAGRFLTLTLWPLTIAEIKGRSHHKILDWALHKHPEIKDLPTFHHLSRREYIHLILSGGYPGLNELTPRERSHHYRSYINTVINKDLPYVWNVKKPRVFKQLIIQLATRTAHEINISTLSHTLGIQRSTLEQYLHVLEKLFLITRLERWHRSESKRDIRASKYHFVDSGMGASLRLLSPESFGLSGDPAALGGMLESFVFHEVLRSLPYQSQEVDLFHWRNRNGREIDIIVDGGGPVLIGIEVKASGTVSAEDFKHLEWFALQGPGRKRIVRGIVFYLGEHAFSWKKGFYALPVSLLWAWPSS